MIATAPRSATALAVLACEAEGVSLPELIANRPKNRGMFSKRNRYWGETFARVCARCVDAPEQPGYIEVARVFGTGHATVHGASRRGRRALVADEFATVAMLEKHGADGLREIGERVAAGLVVERGGRPLYDDGEE